MLVMQRRVRVAPPALTFDPYVPLTAVWSDDEGPDKPRYLRRADRNGYLEFKFHATRGDLLEAVLVAAPGLRVVEERLLVPPPAALEEGDVLPVLDPPESDPQEQGTLAITAYQDVLHVALGPTRESRWVGLEPVLFGLAADDTLVALCALWTPEERALVVPGT